MGGSNHHKNVSRDDARIVQVEVMNDAFVIVVFSNGESFKLESEKLKHLAVSSAAEIALPEED